MRILIVEDEATLRSALERALIEAGHLVDGAQDGETGLYMGREYPVDVAVVDLGLPKLDGLEVIKRWREEGRGFPILILTARGRWDEKVAGLEAGADDYLVKPFHTEELMARLNALWRRAAGWSSPTLECGALTLDTRAQTARLGERTLELTSFEYRLLEHLCVNAGAVISKSDLNEHLYAEDADRDSNVVEVLIGRLRRKLAPDGGPGPIETLRGRGYRFDPERTHGG